jgi:hypothetical protein
MVAISLLPVLVASGALAQVPTPAAPVAAGKTPLQVPTRDSVEDCMRLWDAGTHVSKQEWARTCQRIQTRLNGLKIDNEPMAKVGRKGVRNK